MNDKIYGLLKTTLYTNLTHQLIWCIHNVSIYVAPTTQIDGYYLDAKYSLINCKKITDYVIVFPQNRTRNHLLPPNPEFLQV